MSLLPALLLLLVGVRTREVKPLLLRTTGLVLFGPIALGVWAGEVEITRARSVAARHQTRVQLDLDALYRGAAARSGTPLDAAASAFSGGAFADGSELRVVRTSDEAAAASALTTLVGSRRGQPFVLEGRHGTKLDDGAAHFAYLELHGRDLLEVRAADAESAARRLAAQAVPSPPRSSLPLERPEAQTAPLPSWLVPTLYAVAHLLAFLLFLYWAAQVTSYVAAAARVPIPAEQLCARLLSLNEAGLPLLVSRGPGENVLTVAYRFADPEASSHRAILHLEPARNAVRVRELATHRGSPRSAEEARMQPIGVLDPTRPSSARRVAGAQLLASTISEQELAAVELVLDGARVEVTAPRGMELDSDRMLHLLCAIVTRSGYEWRPGLFFR